MPHLSPLLWSLAPILAIILLLTMAIYSWWTPSPVIPHNTSLNHKQNKNLWNWT